MSLFELLRAGDEHKLLRVLLATNIGGLANVALLESINSAAHAPAAGGLNSLWVFAVWLLIFLSCSRWVTRRIVELLEQGLHELRLRVGRKLVDASFERIESLRARGLYEGSCEHTGFVSRQAPLIASCIHSSVLIVFLVLYVARLSPPAVWLLGLLGAVGVGLLGGSSRQLRAALGKTEARPRMFSERLFARFEAARSPAPDAAEGREGDEEPPATEEKPSRASRARDSLASDGAMFGYALTLLMLGGITYALPRYAALDAGTLTSLLAVAVFAWQPVSALALGLVPTYRAKLALDELAKLEAELGEVSSSEAPHARDPWAEAPIERLDLFELEYRYPDRDQGEPFCVGPMDLELAAGELMVVLGGAGSGKSTLVRVLTGLELPSRGHLHANDERVDADTLQGYREQVSAVYARPHPFEQLYGMEASSSERVEELLARVQLEGVVHYVDGRFVAAELSLSERKRLALVVALLEDRPIYVFDEWPAEQDPRYHAFFFHELLPELCAAGKLVIATSGDARALGRANRVLRLGAGSAR